MILYSIKFRDFNVHVSYILRVFNFASLKKSRNLLLAKFCENKVVRTRKHGRVIILSVWQIINNNHICPRFSWISYLFLFLFCQVLTAEDKNSFLFSSLKERSNKQKAFVGSILSSELICYTNVFLTYVKVFVPTQFTGLK